MSRINKKIVAVTFGLLSLILLVYLLSSNSIKQIPQFDYIEVSTNKHFNTTDLKDNSKKVFIYFSPSCEDCHSLTEEIIKKQNKLGDAQILMVSKRPFDSLKQYMIENDVKDSKNIFVLHDSNNKFVQDFNLGTFVALPTILIFNAENELIFKGNDMNFRDILQNSTILH